MALLLALFCVSIALIFLGTLTSRLVAQAGHVDAFVEHEEAFYGVEAGYTQVMYELEHGEDGLVGVADWDPNSTTFPALDFDSDAVEALSLATLPDVEYFGVAQNWHTDGLDNNGDGVVDDGKERFFYTIYAAARKGRFTRRIEAVVTGIDVNVWRNAIFAGNGQSGGLINGNVSIHGSVHLLGSNLNTGNTALEALDLSGTSLIHNNYSGIPTNIRDRVPALDKVAEGNIQIETLHAKLRVKKGLVGLSGNSEIGQRNVVGDGKKDFMDGTYVQDGWTGNSVVPDGGRGDPKSVYSDNGWDTPYDLGDKVQFPLLTDDWRDPNTGSKIVDPGTGTWYTHEDYFNQVLLGSPTDKTDGWYNGSLTINAKGNQNFYWNATTGVQSSTIPATLPANDDYIAFNPTTNVLRVNGQITINGGLTFTGQGNDKTIYYSGRGALMVKGDVVIDTDLLTCNDGNTSNYTNSFPVNNILGIMSTNNMTVGSTSQLTIMGAFYAQNKITSSKQTNVAGTFVSNYFDMGKNVPSIFQVPSLADNLPLGMIGNYPIMSLQKVSWREL